RDGHVTGVQTCALPILLHLQHFSLDLLILKTISLEPKHGWAIAKRIQQISGEVLQVQQGSLYPALHRLEQKAWIKAKWKETETRSEERRVGKERRCQ